MGPRRGLEEVEGRLGGGWKEAGRSRAVIALPLPLSLTYVPDTYYIPYSVEELRGNLNYRHNLRAMIEELYSIQAIGKKKEMATLSSIRR